MEWSGAPRNGAEQSEWCSFTSEFLCPYASFWNNFGPPCDGFESRNDGNIVEASCLARHADGKGGCEICRPVKMDVKLRLHEDVLTRESKYFQVSYTVYTVNSACIEIASNQFPDVKI